MKVDLLLDEGDINVATHSRNATPLPSLRWKDAGKLKKSTLNFIYQEVGSPILEKVKEPSKPVRTCRDRVDLHGLILRIEGKSI